MFNFLKESLGSIYSQFTSNVSKLFNRTTIDQESLKELETLLLQADTGVGTTKAIIEQLRVSVEKGTIADGATLKKNLATILTNLLPPYTAAEPSLYLLVGINGSGKTTFAGKLAATFRAQGKKVLLVAGDTFRAAATQQLAIWAEKTGAALHAGKENQDPASVIFEGCARFKQEQFDIIIIDTAGRLQTKINLMKELEKIKRIIEKQLPGIPMATLLTVDAMLGQNSLEQARIFNESTALSGIILTKMDSTGKGGIVFAISKELHLPVAYISCGEQVDQIKPFNPQQYVDELLG